MEKNSPHLSQAFIFLLPLVDYKTLAPYILDGNLCQGIYQTLNKALLGAQSENTEFLFPPLVTTSPSIKSIQFIKISSES